jgi:FMN phosphatase YigB (HAD superfamily)
MVETGRPPVEFVYLGFFDTSVALRPVISADLERSARTWMEYNNHMIEPARLVARGEMSFGTYQRMYSRFMGLDDDDPSGHLVPRLQPIEATHDFAERIAAPVGLLTNIGRGVLELCEDEDRGLLPPVESEFVVESHKFGIPLPDRPIIRHAGQLVLERLGVPPSRILYLAKDNNDVNTALGLGWQAHCFRPDDPPAVIDEIDRSYDLLAA